MTGLTLMSIDRMAEIAADHGVRLERDVPLARHTFFGVGGPGWSLRPGLARAGAVAVVGFAAVALLPGWKPAVMTSGMYRYVGNLSQDFTREEFREITQETWELLYYKDGPTSTVTVAWQPDKMEELGGEEVPNLVYMTDGKADASSVGDMRTQVLLAQAPMLLHPRAENVLVIGLASGTTAGSVLTHPVESLDIIEIEPASEPASRLFDFVNGRPLDDGRTSLHFGDARSFLRGAEGRYDLIISEPSNPWMAGPANLFTREFFELGRQALKEGGVFTQWIHTYSLHPELLRSTIATLQSVFPYIYVFRAGSEGDLILVASGDPIVLDVARISARWQIPSVQADLTRVGLPEFGDVMARVRMGPQEVAGLVGGARINTDDNGLLLFGAPLYVHTSTVPANDRLIASASRGVGEYLSFPGATPEIEARFFYYLAGAYTESGLPTAAGIALRLATDRDEEALGGPGR